MPTQAVKFYQTGSLAGSTPGTTRMRRQPRRRCWSGPGAARRFAIDYDYCKGCGICASECPAGAITMVAEET